MWCFLSTHTANSKPIQPYTLNAADTAWRPFVRNPARCSEGIADTLCSRWDWTGVAVGARPGVRRHAGEDVADTAGRSAGRRAHRAAVDGSASADGGSGSAASTSKTKNEESCDEVECYHFGIV